ncbi:hypothetical protein FRACYDRAFT_236703 [Fragilariopsis cylindrus CCMP1102]|uniref:Protein SMG7 n=1 Tax=Fragilariopsis cylindrus CCMP1102 TaxID=635003 RepID=A0A1E7FK50_9STRA|nr:hypothetical protein FRACYDRAFT_236703 [Fragilariopsis cylindrus CCMP1102]|eukprot:OEU18425.1 hypothetical protein FRACYDRAFT_236703 [Fragilariopsis cylindrus CCMP1102]
MPSSTSRSQRQRPGAKVFKSPKDIEKERLQKLDKLLVRATDLESQLSQPDNDDTKAYKLRAHYCEVLSDVLILNPKLALDNDCFQRLWRNCFYKPISIWRQRVSKEKRKRSPNLATSQEGYKSFLSEAIKLFDYLVIQYLSKLCPSATTQPSQTQDSSSTTTTTTAFESSQATEDSSSSITKSSQSLDGVVRGLYKLYIFLGDLHRYAEAYNKAEINYLNASKLGPGLGNPYNQLAVVAFTKEAYCVSLYWYSRSILATHEKFSTSSTNLERLFEKNHEYLMEHGRETIPTVLSLTTTTSFTTTTNNNNNNHNNGKKNNKKTSSNSNSNMVRAQKAAASKSCLAHFVDLHYYFYQQQQLLHKQSLVEASGFSDSLLCKIVVINNFSLERSKTLSSSERLSKELLFSIGIVFAEHIEGNLMKVLEKVKASAASNNMPKTTPSIRYLIPLEMLLDFVLEDIIIVDNDNKNKNEDEQEHQKKKSNITTTTEDVFWKRILVVGNLIKEIVKGYKIEQNFWHGGKSCSQIKEYQLLKGYRPFSIVNKEYMSSIKNKDGYIEPVEAIEVLELSSTSTQTTTLSQDTAAVSTISTGTGSNGGIEENKAKLLRMLEICDSLAASSSAAPLTIKTDDGSYVYCQKNEDKIIDDVGGRTSDKPLTLPIVPVPPGVEISVAAPPPRPSFSVSTENKNKSIETTLLNAIMDTVPQPTESQVAFANDVGMTDATEKTSSYRINNNMVHHHSPAPSLPDVVKPPPGFGGSVTMPDQLYNTLTYNPVPTNPALSLLPLHGLAPATDHSSSLYQLPQQQQHSIIPGLNLPPNSAQASLYPSNNVGSDLLNSKADSSRIFGEYGDVQTANPFVVDPAPSLSMSNAATSNGNHDSSSVPNNYENNNTDVTKFLNAGLLNSLWMDESKTNNPWAEK